MGITKATQNVPTHIQVRCVREHQGTRPGEGTTGARSREGADQEPTILGKASTSSFEQFRALFEALPDAMVVVDQTGAIALVNTPMERLFGYERDELLGRPVEILMPERLRDRHRGHRASYFMAPTVRPMGSSTDLPAARKDDKSSLSKSV